MTASTASETDRQLLQRFVAEASEDAFARLVQRHGPMVLGVCRQILRQEQDAEDAFQATFLVLSRKAGSIRAAEALPNWLYGVARRLALRSKSAVARRQAREVALVESPTAPLAPDSAVEDLAPVLHEEIGRLPEKYRIPFVLCYLGGKTNEEAAQQLGCPSGTVFSRLARARERLRTRLTRRGLALPAGVLTATLAALSQQARAATPPQLATTTVHRALRFGGKNLTGGAAIPTEIHELAEWGVKSLGGRGLPIAVGVAVLVVLLAAGGGLFFALHGNGVSEEAVVQRFQGTWAMKSMVVEGVPVPGFLLQTKLTFTGNQMTLGKTTGTYRLNTQKQPMEIDWICPNVNSFGIFEFRGDSLAICLLQQRRPADFTPGPGTAIMVFDPQKR